MSDTLSSALFERACRSIPGGVNSPVRAFRAVSGDPVFIKRAFGARLIGENGSEYVDFIGSWGPMILGHAHPDVIEAVRDAATRGLSYGAPTELEVRFAEKIKSLYPSIEKLRAVSSGTEATMSAIRVARGFTKRDYIVKFEGCYHGHADHLLVKAGSGLATFGVPDSGGVPAGTAETTLTLPFNDVAALEALFAAKGTQIACVIVEPVVGNMGCVAPELGYLAKMIELTKQHGALTIFDEVMTGCRLSRGGAQELFGLKPDLTTLGKIVGGGMPLAVYGGREEIMNVVAPLGPVYQAGTLSGNPLAVSAGLATLDRLTPDVYDHLEKAGRAATKRAGGGDRGDQDGRHRAARRLDESPSSSPRGRSRTGRDADKVRPKGLRTLLPRTARAGHLLPTRAIRSGVPLRSSHRSRHRPHRSRCQGRAHCQELIRPAIELLTIVKSAASLPGAEAIQEKSDASL